MGKRIRQRIERCWSRALRVGTGDWPQNDKESGVGVSQIFDTLRSCGNRHGRRSEWGFGVEAWRAADWRDGGN